MQKGSHVHCKVHPESHSGSTAKNKILRGLHRNQGPKAEGDPAGTELRRMLQLKPARPSRFRLLLRFSNLKLGNKDPCFSSFY